MSDTFLTYDDKDSMEEVFTSTEENVQYFTSISDELVKSYTENMDSLMSDLYTDCIQNDASDKILEKYLLELNNMLYFLGSKLETVGIKEDLSRLASKESYNNAYLRNRLKDAEQRNKTTVAELTALAEDASKYETVLNSLYSRVYKQLKFKMDAGYDMVNSLRKIITKRMQDQSLSMYQPRNNAGIASGEVY